MLKKGGKTKNKTEGIKVHGGRVNFRDFGTGTAGEQESIRQLRNVYINFLHFKYFNFGYLCTMYNCTYSLFFPKNILIEPYGRCVILTVHCHFIMPHRPYNHSNSPPCPYNHSNSAAPSLQSF